MKLYTMPLYTELEILEYMLGNVYARYYDDFLDRVEYVKDDPATGEPLYQIIPESEVVRPWYKGMGCALLIVLGLLLLGLGNLIWPP